MRISKYIPGVFASVGIAVISLYISKFHASFDALVVSIIMGIFVGNFAVKKDNLVKGVDFSVKFFLRAGIALYGAQLILRGVDISVLIAIMSVFACTYCVVLLASDVFNIDRKTAVLLASGLAICGATAIAVISPLIGAKREDTSVAVISVVMMGLTGIIFYPLINDLFSLNLKEFSFLSGSTLPMLGQVKVVAGSVCRECVAEAVEIKLIRISFLLFVVPAVIFFWGSDEKGTVAGIPYFIIAFFFFAVIMNAFKSLRPSLGYFESGSSFLLSSGLAAIGLSVDFDSIIEEGIAPFAVIMVAWSLNVMLLYFARNIF